VLSDGRLVRYLRGDPDRGHAASDAQVSIAPASVAALTTEGSTMVVALTDGTVCTLDPESFALDRIAAVDGEPLWMAPCAPFSLVVVTRRLAPPAYGVSIIARDSQRVRSFVVAEARTPTALAVDDDTLWFGSSNQLLRIALGTGSRPTRFALCRLPRCARTGEETPMTALREASISSQRTRLNRSSVL
jgi:hypothetical protein